MNNLLVPVLLASEQLDKRLLDPEDQELVAQIQTSAQRGSDVLKQMLKFVRGIEEQRVLLQEGQPAELRCPDVCLEMVARAGVEVAHDTGAP